MPVRTASMPPASRAWTIEVSAPSSCTSAQAKGWSRGCLRSGSATQAHPVTTPPGPTSPARRRRRRSPGRTRAAGRCTRPAAVRLPRTAAVAQPGEEGSDHRAEAPAVHELHGERGISVWTRPQVEHILLWRARLQLDRSNPCATRVLRVAIAGMCENVFYCGHGVQPGRPRRAHRRRGARSHRADLRRPVGDLRRAGGAGQPPGAPPRRPGRRRARPRGHLLVQQHRVRRDDAGRLQAAGRPDQRQLPLRRGRARLPVRQRRRGGGRLPGGVRRPHRRGRRTGSRCCGTWSRSTTAPRTRRRPGPSATRRPSPPSRPSATSGHATTATSTSSTPAAPRACPRASCGATRTCGAPSAAASTS